MDTQGITQRTDKQITQAAIDDLAAIPGELADAERELANIGLDIKGARMDLQDAEIEAQINCAADGKNAEARKLQMDKAVRESEQVKAFREKLTGLENMQIGAEVRFNDLHRRWKSALAVAELQASKIRYLATFERPAK